MKCQPVISALESRYYSSIMLYTLQFLPERAAVDKISN